jgi:hypothetical protein
MEPEMTRAEKKRTIAGIRSAEHLLFFEVEFKNGNSLTVFPDKNDPMRFLVKHKFESLPS